MLLVNWLISQSLLSLI